jgi:hypothetical protein
MTRLLLAIVYLLGTLSLLAASTAPLAEAARPTGGDPLLPNLQALPATDLRLERTGGQTLLRFSTITKNVGAGPLELRAGEVSSDGRRQKVYQRVFLSGGGSSDRLVGDFVYHPEHRHIHFEDYARYELQQADAPGASARLGSKTSFCVMDTTAIDLSLPGAPRRAVYRFCGDRVQGMSVGWGDRYGYQLAGQEIDVTGLPDGTYVLRTAVDPRGKLQEASAGDNVSTVTFRLSPTAGTISPP